MAATLLERSIDPIQVRLFERSGEFGAGIAFATEDPNHVLNVPAGKMSAFEDRPNDFVAWLAGQGVELGDGFVPRLRYREYLRDRLHRTPANPLSQCHLVGEEVISATKAFRLVASSSAYEADYLVLATGYGRRASRAYSPYRPGAWPVDPPRRAAIVGCGLTALDAAISLLERYPETEVVMISRHGMLPEPFRLGVPSAPLTSKPPPGDLRRLVRWLRAEVEAMGWEACFDAMRFRWERLWRGLSDQDRVRFSRHLVAYFNRFRHRIPPALAQQIASHREAGRLRIQQGHVCDFGPGHLRLVEGTDLTFDMVVDASGLSYGVGNEEGLIPQLLEDGRIERDRIGLGFRVTTGEDRLFIVGPPLRGERWESTAVPDIRRQIREVAGRILEDV